MAYDFKQFEERINKVREWLRNELSMIRTGRASSALLDGIRVDSYGAQMPINQLANIVSEDARTLRISPYDQSQTQVIEKSINDADLGISVSVGDNGIRVIFPELTAERREILVKQANNKLEEARVSIRNDRDDVWNEIQKQQKEGDMSEDDKFTAKERMQKIVDSVQDDLDQMISNKESEITA